MSIKKQDVFIAMLASGSFIASFMLGISAFGGLFIHLFPSKLEDDVRFDLLLPTFITAYLIATLISLIGIKIAAKFIGALFVRNFYLRFMVVTPFLALLAYLVIGAIIGVFIELHFINRAVDNIALIVTPFAVMTAGYYVLLSRNRRDTVSGD